MQPDDRFTYWPPRVARGGRVLVPGRPEALVRAIDARDLAGWMVRMIEDERTGQFNATGPASPLTMGKVLEACRAVSGNDAELVWVDEAFLLREAVGPWIELPLWVPEAEGTNVSTASIARALAAGLTFRPLAETVCDTLAWDATRPANHAWRAGLAAERERELLAAWAAEH